MNNNNNNSNNFSCAEIKINDEVVAVLYNHSTQEFTFFSKETQKSDSSLINVVSAINKYDCFESYYKSSGIPVEGPNGDSFFACYNIIDSNDVLYFNMNTDEIASSILHAMPVQDCVEYYGNIASTLKKINR